MVERAYTLAEIDRMRLAIRRICMIGVSLMMSEKYAEIEDQLRTYMMGEELELEAATLRGELLKKLAE